MQPLVYYRLVQSWFTPPPLITPLLYTYWEELHENQGVITPLGGLDKSLGCTL